MASAAVVVVPVFFPAALLLVDLTFFLVWFKWPLGVSVVSGQYLETVLSCMMGHPVKFHALIALSHVDLTR